MTLYSIAMYGGLLLFSAMLLHDTQRIIHAAANQPMDSPGSRFDPINHSMSIYMDTINIFMRIAIMMAGGKKKR